MIHIKKSIVLLFIIALLAAAFSLAQPPSFENHQFHGTVEWSASLATPPKVIAKIADKEYSAAISDVSCGEDTCTGTYGKSADNILRVQGDEGDTISFYLDAVFIKDEAYIPDEVTELALTHTGLVAELEPELEGVPLECSHEWNCTDWSECINDNQTRNCTRMDDCDAKLVAGEIDSIIETDKPEELRICPKTHEFYGIVIWESGLEEAPASVVAKIGDKENSSLIKNVTCNGNCSGTYGKPENNSLAMEGAEGDIIFFYLGETKVAEESFVSGGVTELNLTYLIEEEEEEIPLEDCLQVWDCSGWSACIGNIQTRSCFRTDDCNVKLATGKIGSIIETTKPSETQTCVPPKPITQEPAPPLPPPVKKATCYDGIQNQNEEDVDCGGICPDCPKKVPWAIIIISIIVVLGIIGALVYFLVLRKGGGLTEDVKQELTDYFQKAKQKGMKQEQIISKLIQAGWDEKVVQKFLKKR